MGGNGAVVYPELGGIAGEMHLPEVFLAAHQS